MATTERFKWQPQFQGMSRRDRTGCYYDAYIPDPINGWTPDIPADIAADIADAEADITALNADGVAHPNLEGLTRFLLRAESVGSSKIEGLDIAAPRLARAEVALALGGDPRDQTAVEILGNITAMEAAIQHGASPGQFTAESLLNIHRTLMDRSPHPHLGGVIREEQNWIGGSSYNPCSASFIPPPYEHVPGLWNDLLTYVNNDQHSPVAQAAIAHAQFETIHPFGDGNGRTGRALIHVILARRGAAPQFVPPISLVLATLSDDYINGLSTFRHMHPADSDERSEALANWLQVFAFATRRACADARVYATEVKAMTTQWRAQMGKVRAGSATDKLINVLPGAPIVTTRSAADLIGRSTDRTGDAINALVDAGVLRQRNVGAQRYRVFEATAVLNLFTDLERALASPVGDTNHERPVRPVPQRPSQP